MKIEIIVLMIVIKQKIRNMYKNNNVYNSVLMIMHNLNLKMVIFVILIVNIIKSMNLSIVQVIVLEIINIMQI